VIQEEFKFSEDTVFNYDETRIFVGSNGDIRIFRKENIKTIFYLPNVKL
jgi:hypothetical protein